MGLRIGYGGTGHDEGGTDPVLTLAHPPQPPQHQACVAAESTPAHQDRSSHRLAAPWEDGFHQLTTGRLLHHQAGAEV